MIRTAGHALTRWALVAVAILLMLATADGAARAGGKNGSSPQVSELNSIRGVVKPAVEAVLSSEIQARISRMPFRDGQRFNKGDTLVDFDCAKYQAELSAAVAEHGARRKTLDNNLELAQLNAIGTLEVELSEAEAKKAEAAVQIARVMVGRCRIRAPFSGRVVKTVVHEHETVSPKDALLGILDDRRLEIELILPSKSLPLLKKGTGFTFQVDETGRVYPAKVGEIGARVDPVSQTIRVLGVFHPVPEDVLSGMSGSAAFPEKAQ